MGKYSYILFDLDGTLTDPFEGITKCVQYALNYYGIKDEPLKSLKKFIGPPLKESFMVYYGFDDQKAEGAVEKYRERFQDIGIFENKLYEGVDKMLQSLKESGYVLAIASSKPTVYVERILEHFHVAKYFDNITGSFLDGRRTKKSEVIEAVLTELDISDRSKVLMVGDRLHDVEGAAEAGIDCLGAGFGYGGREELETAGAIAVADTVKDVLNYIKNSK